MMNFINIKLKNILGLTLAVIFMVIFSGFNNINISAEDTDNYGVNLAYKRRMVVSGVQDNNNPTNINDDNDNSRWSSDASDDAWIYFDLGTTEKINKIYINWEASYATRYKILLSNDAVNWTQVADVSKTNINPDTLTWDYYLEAKFVKLQCISRALGYGISIYEFEIYGQKSLSTGSGVNVLEVSNSEFENSNQKDEMVDFSASTRWASSVADNQFFIVDLGSNKTFDNVKIRWEVSFARIFEIYISDTATTRADESWVKVYRSDTGLGEVDDLFLSSDYTARYIKVELIQRETYQSTKQAPSNRYPWQSTFSIYSFELYNWDEIKAVPIGSVMEFSKNAAAFSAMSNITLNPSGLILAPHDYPNAAEGISDEQFISGDIPGFESYGTYNPAVVVDGNGIFRMIYRSELPDNFSNYFGEKNGKGHMSSLSYAYSSDGVNWIRGNDNPVVWPNRDEEKWGGTEDPRMFKIKDEQTGVTTYYITYTMYNNSRVYEGMSYTTDFIHFTKVGDIAPGYGDQLKSGTFAVDPEGNAVMINDPRPGKTGRVYICFMKDGGYARVGFTTDVTRIQPQDIVNIDSAFGNNSIESLTNGNESCVAITNIYGQDDEEIYLMYGGGKLSNNDIQYQQANVNGWFYALGVLKCSKSNPFELMNVRNDLSEPFMYPTQTNKIDYGLFPKCMFADTMLRYNDKWYFYYGAGDMYVGLATSSANFSAGAATYTGNGDIITAATKALNKKYNGDKTQTDVKFMADVYDLSGNLLQTFDKSYNIKHFSQTSAGLYSKGQDISVDIDISGLSVENGYYIVSYVTDTNGAVLNNTSSYTVINANVANS